MPSQIRSPGYKITISPSLKLAGKSILIVDDEPLICEVFSELLSSEGAQITIAHSGNSALTILGNKAFDILISDVRMPDGDGLTLVRELRNKNLTKMRIYFCSGYNDVSGNDLQDFVVLAVFPKPFDFSEILKALI